MKKLPCPAIYPLAEPHGRVAVHFEWEFISFEMFDDEALLLARSIYDVLQGLEPETDGGSLSPWGET